MAEENKPRREKRRRLKAEDIYERHKLNTENDFNCNRNI